MNAMWWPPNLTIAGFINQTIFLVLTASKGFNFIMASLYAGFYRDWYVYYGQYSKATVDLGLWSLILGVFNIGLAVGVVIAVGMLLLFQVRAILNNRTAIEDWILEKARHRTETAGEKPFQYPYNLGKWRNFLQVASWFCASVGSDVEWAVADGCDQYTLTLEQLKQKSEKLARTRTYTINCPVSGSWIPLWSQGFRVCLDGTFICTFFAISGLTTPSIL